MVYNLRFDLKFWLCTPQLFWDDIITKKKKKNIQCTVYNKTRYAITFNAHTRDYKDYRKRNKFSKINSTVEICEYMLYLNRFLQLYELSEINCN